MNHGRKMKQKKTDKQRERKKRKTRGKRPFLYIPRCIKMYISVCVYFMSLSLSLYNKGNKTKKKIK